MIVDKHTVAAISIVGSSLDMLGALYLAYDLLGGEHGPLRTLTRAVTYGAMFGVGLGLALGPVFGLINGATFGGTLAWELSLASRQQYKRGFWHDTAMSAIRGCGFALGFAHLFGINFGLMFGALSTVGQVIAYSFGIRPSLDYEPATKPRLTKRQFLAAVNRTAGYALAGYLSALVAHQREKAFTFGWQEGLLIGVVTVVTGSCTPFIEWTADHLPAKRMGVIGIAFILTGFTLQSVQYWLTLLNIDAR